MRKSFLITVMSFIHILVLAQNSTMDNSHAKSLLNAYFSPASHAMGSVINNGWFHTAKPHKLGGFDISLTLNAVMIPDIGKNFNINNIANPGVFSSSDTSSATFLGNKNSTSTIYDVNPSDVVPGIDFNMPGGQETDFIPMPMLKVGIGLIKGTEINLRYLPPQKIYKAAKTRLYGFGMKHDILQWLPMVDKIPLDFSIQGAYTNLDAEVVVENEGINMNIQATTVNLIMSKEILMVTPLLALGYRSSKTTIDLENPQNYTIGNVLNVNSDDIFPLRFDSEQDFVTTLGIRWDILILAIEANYTFAEYPVATLGIGVTVR